MRRLSIGLLLAASVSTHALALDDCKPGIDQLVRLCTYKPTQRYFVSGIVNEPVDLVFDPGERIKRLEWAYNAVDAKGVSFSPWHGPKLKGERQYLPNGNATPATAAAEGMPANAFANNLPIWPSEPGTSRLQVITETKDGEERPYQFELFARLREPNCDAHPDGAGCPVDTATTTALQFTYPEVAKAAAVQAWRVQQAAHAVRVADDRLKVDPFYGAHNWKYQAHGKQAFATLAPSKIADNGRITAMVWPGNVPVPSVYIFDPQTKTEVVAPRAMREDGILVVQSTAEWFRLRLGDKAVLDIHNLAFTAERPGRDTGTTSSDVVRQVISTQ